MYDYDTLWRGNHISLLFKRQFLTSSFAGGGDIDGRSTLVSSGGGGGGGGGERGGGGVPSRGHRTEEENSTFLKF